MGFLSGITSFVKEHSDVIHGVLDVAGFIPGVGAVADLANAGLYAAEGNWLDAGLSLASAVPGIGDTIALAKKSGKALKGLKGLKSLKGFNALDKAKGMKSLFGALKGKAKTGASKVKGWLKNRKEALKNIKKRLKGECVNGRCFTGDTLVYTRHGYKTIKEIQKGDEVYSRNAETGETGFKEVEEVFCTTAHTIYHVWIDGKEEIKTTAYHPVYVEGQGWVTAINLREGDAIETVEGMACITKIVKERHEEPVTVYNFHVKEWASYFVGEVRVYVHNGHNHPVKRINVGSSGHHVPAVRKSKKRKFEVKRSDKTRPTIFSKGSDPGYDHWRMHDAEREYIGPRQGDFKGSDKELFDSYRKAYKKLGNMKVDVKSPNGKYILGKDVTPSQAVDLIEDWLKKQGLY